MKRLNVACDQHHTWHSPRSMIPSESPITPIKFAHHAARHRQRVRIERIRARRYEADETPYAHGRP